MKTKRLVFISIFVALALVLDYIKSFIPFLNMPSGGSINIALIPIVICSFKLDYKAGFIAGFLWWLVSSLLGLNNYFISVAQYLMDYILPSIIPGLCSVFYKKKNNFEMIMGIIVCMTIRTLCVVISGAIFWPGDVASNSLAAWSASLVYNLPYSLITTIVLAISVPIIIKAINFDVV